MRIGKNNETKWLAQGVEGLIHQIGRAPDAPLFDIVVVGSGYGGAVAAARLAGCQEAGKTIRVCVLERGQEYLPGMFPQRFHDLPAHVRFGTLKDPKPKGRRTGLFDLRIAPDVSVLLGSGLGGGSLINAGVMAEPRPEVFDVDWPQEISHAKLAPHFDEVRRMLGVQQTTRRTRKLVSLYRLGRALGSSKRDLRCEVAVNFKQPKAGFETSACLNCGDCFTGCNHGAKGTLDTNYLKLARERGAEIFTGATVLALERPPGARGLWDVLFTFTHEQTSRTDRGPFRLRCRRVILAAGSLGSTEILLRSQQQSQFVPRPRQASRLLPSDSGEESKRVWPLKFSALLGHRFSTNADMFAVAYQQRLPANAAARQEQEPKKRKVGPTITGLIDLRGNGEKPLSDQVVIEEMAVPGALRPLFAEAVTTFASLYEIIAPAKLATEKQPSDPLAVDDDAIHKTAFYALMGHDGAAGQLQLQPHSDPVDPTDGFVYPRWSNAGSCPAFKTQIELLERACGGATGGALCKFVIPSPLWRPLPASIQKLSLGLPTGDVLTVHPLGGCAIGNDASDGVVDHLGRVFEPNGAAPSRRPSVHEGLVVLDGSIIPSSLGINPALTIAAVAERAVGKLKQEWKLTDAGTVVIQVPPRPTATLDEAAAFPTKETEIEVSEQLSGPIVVGGREVRAKLEVAFAPFVIPSAIAGRHEIRNAALTLDDAQSEKPIEFKLAGHVILFERETDRRVVRVGRALLAYLRNRCADDMRTGLRNKVASFGRSSRGEAAGNGNEVRLADWWKLIYRLCESACQGWRLVYDLRVVSGPENSEIRRNDTLRGVKLITYAPKANPWRQLSEIDLSWTRGSRSRRLGKLTLDLDYFVRHNHPLLCITAQENQPQAVADLLSFGGYLARMLLRTHLLSFKPQSRRRPDEEGNLQRLLPEALPAAPIPQVVNLTTVTSSHGNVNVRLTRYPPTERSSRGPVLLLHGFGASGSTFAHALVKPNLVQRLVFEGFDVWVADLRTSVALPTANHPWSMDEVARTDVVAAVDEVLHATGAPRIDVVAHCIGAAMFAYAILSGRLEGKLRSAVLSQVGPVSKFSPPNLFRAYLASYLAHYVPARVFDIRPSPVPSMLETAVDRLLATYPYSDREWKYNNPPFGQRVPQATMRRRADGIWGQLFEHDNVDPDIVSKLDEFLGRVNVANLAQTMHYALREALTIEQGIGSALDQSRLKRFWNFPTRFLFGTMNRVFDESGVRQSCELLGSLLVEQDTPERSGKQPFDCIRIAGYGHQDVFIAKDADSRVFRPHIVPFLNTQFGPIVPKMSGVSSASTDRETLAPRFGPLLGWLRDVEGGICCRMTIAPPVDLPEGAPHLAASSERSLRSTGESDDPGWPDVSEVSFASASDDVRDAVRYETEVRTAKAASPVDAAGAFHLSRRVLRARDRCKFEPVAEGVSFALGSCQYPPGLLDRGPATASFRRLAERLDKGDDSSPQFLLLVGDQIYADETAGLFASNITDERYTGFHERLFTRAEVQRVLSQLPTYMMLDDHELQDNWEPPRAGDWAAEQASRQAALAFQRYQWNSGPGPAYQKAIGGSAYWYSFFPGGFPFFVMDTRTERNRRVERKFRRMPAGTRLTKEAEIMSLQQSLALQNWLLTLAMDDRARYAPKFIVTPSVVLPWSSEFDEDPATAARADGWEGYPLSLRWLLGFIAIHHIENVVFLSGDRHASLVGSVDLTFRGKTVTAHSIVSSALYAPFPFINARPRDLALDTTGTWQLNKGVHLNKRVYFDYRVSTLRVDSRPLVQSDAYAVVHVDPASEGWTLRIEFDTATGLVVYPSVFLANRQTPVSHMAALEPEASTFAWTNHAPTQSIEDG